MKVVITGISQGIGAALVQEFLNNKHQVVGTTRNKINIDQELLNYSGLSVFESDFIKVNEYNRLAKFVEHELGSIDVLINNAGLLIKGGFNKLSEDQVDQAIHVNFKMPFFITQALVPYIKESGHVVNISSRGGVQGSQKFAGLSAYSSMKGALNILTECLNEELEDIRCNSLSLGAVQTEMLQQAFPGYKAPISPNTMATFIYHFATTSGDVMSGQNISVSLSSP